MTESSAAKRLLSVIHYAPFSGPTNANMRLAPALLDAGFETIALLPDEPGDGPARLREAGIDVVTMPLHRVRAVLNPLVHATVLFRFWFEVWAIRRIIRERHIDLVQLNGLINPHGAFAARLAGVKVVWHIPDTRTPQILRRPLMFLVRRLADAVLVTGRAVAAEHPGALDLGKRLVSYFPPVDTETFAPDRKTADDARAALGLTAGDTVVGTVGNVVPQKDHATFIRAAASLHRTMPETRFVICGAVHDHFQDYAEGLWTLAEELGLKFGRDLVWRNPGNRVDYFMQAFDVFWMTSEPRSEGIPTVIGEAMALGKPVVTTQVGAVDEAVDEGVTGCLVAPRDSDAIAQATARILGTPGLVADMGRAAKAAADNRYSIAASAARHLQAYRVALGEIDDPGSAAGA